MSVFQAFREGLGRVLRAPVILFSVWLLGFLVCYPSALLFRGVLVPQPGRMLARENVFSGLIYTFVRAAAAGVDRPAILGAAAAGFGLIWLLLAGGVLDRYARDHPIRTHGFFGASAVFFFRFLRLAVVVMLVYAVLFGLLQPWLLDRLSPRIVFGVLAGLVAAFQLIVDYAMVRAVVEDRRSMLGAINAAIRFIAGTPAAIALYALDVAMYLLLAAGYRVVAPVASLWVGFVFAQLYVVTRLAIKLTFWASEIALFQGRLAHAGYVAAPAAAWPESPTAEAISRL